ncbi:proposed homoserine kinase [Porphyromonas crevioricanis JCM 15906]|uniref:Proposed homoserine kinase n=1 Tax=Porphyromonas crevioricanis JCM 15906 TaxID=1305617 RepID=T1DSK8_9PORP|nr:homoserine kinase [Porphyromonas crevioricanis]GAD05314.1 proposed homoserine kinase [Porphyromonas crevioricanis JCM 15906]SJZ86595.1 phosphoglycerate mutase (2,3-diphosphoglycerate-independent) [Porphyromonas crevioricanis]
MSPTLPWLDHRYSQLVVLLDGAADEPHRLLDGRTPYRAASMPALNALLPLGRCGTFASIPEGCSPGSEVANLCILGYAEEATKVDGRAGFEALGLGLDLPPGSVCYRCDMPGLPDMSLFPTSIGRLCRGVRHRHVFVPSPSLPEKESLDALQNFILSCGLPPAGLWGRSVVRGLNFTPFAHRYGMQGAMISAVPVMWGMALALGMKRTTVEGATGDTDSNFAGKAAKALELLQDFQFVYLHIEAPDEASHRKDPLAVRDVLERIDSDVITKVSRWWHSRSGGPKALTIMPDHYTSSTTGEHLSIPVPYLHLRNDDRA